MNISIRIARLDDLEAILMVFKNAIEAISPELYSKDQKKAWLQSVRNKTKWKDRLQSQYFLVAVANSEIVAFSSLDQNGLVDLLYVDPNHQKKGIAQLLLNSLTEEAKQKDIKDLTTFASKAAVDFFKKNGFLQVSENQANINGQNLINYIMKKEL